MAVQPQLVVRRDPSRTRGNSNFYLASERYGSVEIGHLTICHAILDFLCGLPAPDRQSAARGGGRRERAT